MRIRKDKKLAQLGLSSGDAHSCQLNQSPWDVPSSTATSSLLRLPNNLSSSSFRSPLFQVVPGREDELETSLTGNGSLGDSLGGVDSSEDSMVEVHGNGNGIGETVMASCNKTNGKGWQCKKAAKTGHSMCSHHLTQLKSYNHNHDAPIIASSSSSPPPVYNKKKAAGSRRGRGRPTKKAPEENPYTFYYYTGFGPTWGRKRSGGQAPPGNGAHQAPIFSEESDDDDEEEGEEKQEREESSSENESERPVKERSLKSLM